MSDYPILNTMSEYFEAVEQVSSLFEDHDSLPAAVQRPIIRDLFRTCRKELKFKYRLNLKVAKDAYKDSLAALAQEFKERLAERKKKPEPPQTPKKPQESLPAAEPAQPLPPGMSEQNAEPVAIIPSSPAKP